MINQRLKLNHWTVISWGASASHHELKYSPFLYHFDFCSCYYPIKNFYVLLHISGPKTRLTILSFKWQLPLRLLTCITILLLLLLTMLAFFKLVATCVSNYELNTIYLIPLPTFLSTMQQCASITIVSVDRIYNWVLTINHIFISLRNFL